LVGLSTWALKLLLQVDKKVGNMEIWKIAHDKQDDGRHEENLEKFDRIFEILNKQQRR
jgi:hypothetical protein